MNIADLQFALLETAVYGSLAILLVLALRWPLRSALGAGAAYLVWALIPLAMVSALLPVATFVPAIAVPTLSSFIMAASALPVPQSGVPGSAGLLLVAWATGTLIATIVLVLRQRQFVRGLGCIAARSDGTFVAQVSAGLPAVIGILRPRIVLPADFAVRFDPAQQQMVRDHEQMHIAHGDQFANLLALVLRCLFWFNPLVYWAVPRFRQDQELACDARVIARHPQARRQYGETLLRAQLLALDAPLSCQMGFSHPLKERIAMLNRPVPGSTRRIVGAASVLLFVIAAGFAANAQEVQTAPDSPAKIALMPGFGGNFPPAAQARGLSGIVRVAVEYDERGMITRATVTESDADGMFDDAALASVRQIQIRPAVRNGKATSGRIVIPVQFSWQPTPQ